MKRIGLTVLLSLGMISSLSADTVNERLDAYRGEGAGEFSAERGRDMWFREFTHAKADKPRSCTSCHGTNGRVNGKHARTGKAIKPISPSVNPERLSATKKIEKWFKRNCKWTLGRECTVQEKGDFLAYLRTL